MLKPSDRRVLTEALRPPQGYRVDRTLATTYSLDLLALLMAPLSFSVFDRVLSRGERSPGLEDAQGATALLQAVREHASRLVVFCEAGRIARPPKYRSLLTYLERSVVEVQAPSPDGVFHPKVWVQRLTAPGQSTRYRLIVSSRNLTFDRSWDTMLVLDGVLTGRTNAYARNHPLGDFVASLPGLALRPLSNEISSAIAQIADELRRVDFELPPEFDELAFWPLGHDRKPSWPFSGRADRWLVVSPFVSEGTLRRLSASEGAHVLVSRAEELAPLPASALAGFSETFVLDSAAELESEAPEDDTGRADAGARGLHAKLFVADAGWRSRLWTGSANATDAAFRHNVELLVELGGKRSVVGVDAILGAGGGDTALRSLLLDYSPPPEGTPSDSARLAVEAEVERIRRAIARAPWRGRVEVDPAAAESYRVILSAKGATFDFGAGAAVWCWPITVAPEHGQGLLGGAAAEVVFPRCSFLALTTFFAFRVRVQAQDVVEEVVFVSNVPLEGLPESRESRVLLAMLDDPSKVLRFLQLLLALDPEEGGERLLEGEGEAEGEPWTGGARGGRSVVLLEVLLQALDRAPERLSELDRTITELRRSPAGAAHLPAELDAIWAPIRAAWRARGKAGGA